MIEAHIICDSVSPDGIRLTTFKLRYPKFIHGEFMTHRVFSRNASSSRAIPVKKMIEEVRSDAERASPVWWGKNQKGMQAAEELDDGGLGSLKQRAIGYWNSAADHAADVAGCMERLGTHKQIVNRVLEPFLHINVVCTATEYMNFFGLRLDKAAQPEMRVLAETMWKRYQDHEPTKRQPGDWHLPFYCETQDEQLFRRSFSNQGEFGRDRHIMLCRKLSAARCARVSYESFETGKRSTIEEDLALCETLLAGGHWSPFEHQATPDELTGPYDILVHEPSEEEKQQRIMRTEITAHWKYPQEHGNFKSWRQYRKMIEGEAVRLLPDDYR